jgi:hypothetical protein
MKRKCGHDSPAPYAGGSGDTLARSGPGRPVRNRGAGPTDAGSRGFGFDRSRHRTHLRNRPESVRLRGSRSAGARRHGGGVPSGRHDRRRGRWLYPRSQVTPVWYGSGGPLPLRSPVGKGRVGAVYRTAAPGGTDGRQARRAVDQLMTGTVPDAPGTVIRDAYGRVGVRERLRTGKCRPRSSAHPENVFDLAPVSQRFACWSGS